MVYFSGANPFYSVPQGLTILIQAAISFYSIRYFRLQKNALDFSFGEGIIFGVLVTLFCAVFSGLVNYAFIEFLYPEMIPRHIIELQQYLLTNKASLVKESSLEVFEGNLRNVQDVTAVTLGIDEFIWKMVKGTMFTILVSLTQRRKEQSV
jgi:hypothetical protein